MPLKPLQSGIAAMCCSSPSRCTLPHACALGQLKTAFFLARLSILPWNTARTSLAELVLAVQTALVGDRN